MLRQARLGKVSCFEEISHEAQCLSFSKFFKFAQKSTYFYVVFPALALEANTRTGGGGEGRAFLDFQAHSPSPQNIYFYPMPPFHGHANSRNIATRKQPSQKSGVSYQIVNITASAESARGGRK